MPKLQLLHFKM